MTDGSTVPDKPLTVKCKLEHNSRDRRQKLTFQTARNCTYDGLKEKITKHFQLADPFQIQWVDDDHEQNLILDQTSLNEAISFFHSGDEGSVASGSVFTSRNSSRYLKITMDIEICVGYDGPSLSDTASLASRDEDSLEGSQMSFSPGELASSPQDDDAVTVSSKDTGPQHSSLIKKIWNGTSRSGSGSTQNRPLPKPSRSRIFNLASSRASTTVEESAGGSTRGNMINGRSSGSLMDTERPHPDDPSAVFERLKLLDDSHDRSPQNEIGTWLQEQTTLQMRATLGVVPSISTSDSFSLNTDTPLSDGDPGADILLEKNERGRYYYTYTGSGSSDSAGEIEYEVVNRTQPVDEMGIPHELLVPEEVTDCSECGRVLDQIKYTCTTCGEKIPMSRAALAAAAAAAGIGKGKSRDYDGSAEYEWQELNYSPCAHRIPGVSYNHSNTKPLPALPSTSPTQTIFGRSLGSQSTLVPSSSSVSLSPTRHVGYELCAVCFEKVGLEIDHALPGGMDSPSSPTMQPTPQERSVARRSAPKRKGELRHAFLFQVWGFNGWQDIEQEEAHSCSGCQSLLSGIRYKCGKCDNFTICRACYNEVHNIHPIHPFLERRVKPPSRWRSQSEGLYEAEDYDDYVDEPSLKHPGVECFNCQQDIVGARFHCVDCTTIDIDICSNCETVGLPGNLDASDGGHDPSSHMMLKIPMPLNMQQVQHVSHRAHGLRNGRDRADLRGVSPLMRSNPGSVSSISAGTVLHGDNGGGDAEIEEDYVHLQVCNSCGDPIVGARYQCLNCPSIPNSFNLCSDCEVKSYRAHDAMHTFLKLPRPVDIAGPLESEFPIIPILYRDPAGPTPGSPAAEISGDPAAYLRDLTHSFALCDRHMIRIVGKWYRCAFCAKDLCAECEALDSHDSTHVFLVFKAPVDMQSFRHFADLQNPAGSPPVLRGNIYVPQHD